MKSQRGLTLIELLVVVAIMGILGTITVPLVQKVVDDQQRNATQHAGEGLRATLGRYNLDKDRYPYDEQVQDYTSFSATIAKYQTLGPELDQSWSFSRFERDLYRLGADGSIIGQLIAAGVFKDPQLNPGEYALLLTARDEKETRILVTPRNVQVEANPGSGIATPTAGGANAPGMIAGLVKDQSGAPIPGATLTLNSLSVLSDSDGKYRLVGLTAGTYSVTASAPGFPSVTLSVTVAAGLLTNQDFTLTSYLASGYGAITGKVTNEAGNPIAGATVQITTLNLSVTTASDGTYTLSQLNAGTYNVTASAPAYVTLTKQVTVTSGQTATLDFQLTAGFGGMSGQVTDGQSPLRDATVTIERVSAVSGAAGAYSISNIPTGTYQATASKVGHRSHTVTVTITNGQTLTQDFALPPADPGTLSGTVTSQATGAPIVGATVMVAGLPGTTDSLGVYTITGVPPGTYNATASADGHATQSLSVTISENTTTTANFSLPLSFGRAEGTVKNSSGTAIQGATVSVAGLSASTNSNGAWAIENIPSGSHTITASAAGYLAQSKTINVTTDTVTVHFTLTSGAARISGFIRKSDTTALAGATVSLDTGEQATSGSDGGYQIATNNLGNRTLTVTATGYLTHTESIPVLAGQEITKDVTLFQPGIITGTVRNSQGNPVQDVTVSANGQSAQTDRTGLYTLTNILPGTWVVNAKRNNAGASATVTVGEGQTVTQDFTIANTTMYTISGTVKSTTGASIAGATVKLETGEMGTTASDGTYSISSVLPATYNITVSATGYTTVSQQVTVTADQTLNFQLQVVPATVTGTIKKSDGSGLQGVVISLDTGEQTTTAANGTYSVTTLNFGTRTVTAVLQGYSSLTTTRSLAAGAIAVYDATMYRTTSLTGTITNTVGKALSGATVTYAGSTAITGSDGVYTFSSVTPGTSTITVTRTNYTTISQTLAVTEGAQNVKDFTMTATALYTLSGTVRDAATTQAVSGAAVRLDTGESATTAADGSYSIGNIVPATYTVTFSATGYQSQSVVISIEANTTSSVSLQPLPATVSGTVTDSAGQAVSGATVRLDTGEQTTSNASGAYTLTSSNFGNRTLTVSASGYVTSSSAITLERGGSYTRNVTLYQPGKITGTVTNAWAKPLSGATVSGGGQSAITDAQGYYELSGLAPGSVTVTVTRTHYQTQTASVAVTENGTTTKDFTLTASTSFSLSGTVADARTSSGISGATVRLDTGQSVTTGSNGSYSLTGILPATYTVSFSATGFETHTTVIQIEANVTSSPSLQPIPAVISGTVTTSAGAALSGANVSLDTGESAVTDASGAYSISTLNAGTRTITAAASGYTSASSTLTISYGGSYTQDFTLRKPGTITGTVVNTQNKPLSGAAVSTSTGQSATTDAYGSYTLNSVPAGTVTVSVTRSGYQAASASVTVSEESTITQNFTLTATTTYTFSGTVLDDSNGRRISGALVRLDTGQQATTDSRGNFSISGILPATYTVTTSATNYVTDVRTVIIESNVTGLDIRLVRQ